MSPDRDVRRIERDLIRSTVHAREILARIDPCPMSPDSDLWAAFVRSMQALAQTWTYQDQLLDMRATLA